MHCETATSEASSAAAEVGQFSQNSLAPAYIVLFIERPEREKTCKSAIARAPPRGYFLSKWVVDTFVFISHRAVSVCCAPAQSFMEEVHILCGYIVNNKFYDGKKKIYLRVIDIHFICSRELFSV